MKKYSTTYFISKKNRTISSDNRIIISGSNFESLLLGKVLIAGLMTLMITMTSWFCQLPAYASEGKADLALLELRKTEPTFSEIWKSVIANQNLSPSKFNQWNKWRRQAAYVPTVSFGYDRALKDTDTVKVSDNISVTSDAINIGPQESDWNQSSVAGDVFRFRATWDFSKAVYSSDIISISREQRDLTQQHLQLSDYLFKIYGKRHDQLVEYLSSTDKNSTKSLKSRELVLDLTDQLNAWTAGEFSHRWWKGKR